MANRLVYRNALAASIALTLLSLGGCGDSSSNSPDVPDFGKPTNPQDPSEPQEPTDPDQPGVRSIGVVASVSSDWASGGVSYYDTDNNFEPSGPFHEGISDIDVVGGQGFFYYIEKFGTDRISRIDITNPAQKTWTFSTNKEGVTSSSNPYTLVTVSADKAYLLRYDSSEVWIVNPGATVEQDFYLDSIDLSAFSHDGQSAPQMADAILVEGKLYIAIQRLKSWAPDQAGLIIVIDTTSDVIIDVNPDTPDIDAIELQGFNPSELAYLDDAGLIISHIGTYTYSPNVLGDGGIELLDPVTLTSKMVVPQTDETGNISSIAIKDKDTGYFTGYRFQGWTDPALTEVFTFDPTPEAGVASGNAEAIAHLGTSDFRDVAISPDGNLWVANASTTTPGIHVLDPGTNSEIIFVDSPEGLLPENITFVTTPR
ncbi:hypothetical protein KUV44_10100 [Marinobacter daepoensis]|uniref:Uncharacterized protein n=1 Tax=Marinobacter daepoensis TaxID=262077 RepID=A0ABS3BEV6_9GAMM|nr:hypothetical protein [Marinobacter daepoensis]MBN7768755.1 hypothetical protein [Marinobacter daepoensis]MBY6079492.1 hypothetical protein [Marinobacter daepoensis]